MPAHRWEDYTPPLARQMVTEEMDDPDLADFEGAYDEIVMQARSLPSPQPGGQSDG